MGNVENNDIPYVETDLHTVASKKLQKEIEEDLKVKDPSAEDAKSALRKSE